MIRDSGREHGARGHRSRFGRCTLPALAVAAFVALAACGSDGDGDGGDDKDDKGGETGSKGMAPAGYKPDIAAWADYCVAEFTEDAKVELFGGDAFTVKKGEKHLVARARAFEFIKLAEPGPFEFEAKDAKFSNSCGDSPVETHTVAFADLVFYSDKDLKTEACRVKAGEGGKPEGGYGYAMVSGSNVQDGKPTPYEVTLGGAFGEKCASPLFYGAPDIEIQGDGGSKFYFLQVEKKK